MTTESGRAAAATSTGGGDLAIVHCGESFTLGPGNRMRASGCPFCAGLIGGEVAAVIGVAALDGDPCTCGALVCDVFIIHASHLPVSGGALQAAITRGINCPSRH